MGSSRSHSKPAAPATPAAAAPSSTPAKPAAPAPARKLKPGEFPPRTARQIKVRAIAVGYYDDKLRRIDDVFTINDHRKADGELSEFSHKWMELVDADTPERQTSHNDAIREAHDETLAGRATAGGSSPKTPDVLGDD